MGVSYNTYRNKWHAKVQRNGVSEDIGMFVSKDDAVEAVRLHKLTPPPVRPKKVISLHSPEWFEQKSQAQVKQFSEIYK